MGIMLRLGNRGTTPAVEISKYIVRLARQKNGVIPLDSLTGRGAERLFSSLLPEDAALMSDFIRE